ncbi:MAG: hypothetical protein ABJC12_08950, partial [Saprospiraceae bacterium]
MIRIYACVISLAFFASQNLIAQEGPYRSGPVFKNNSVLSAGTIHKIAVRQAGIYKLDYNFIKDNLKIDPGTLNPSQITLFGNGGGRLPQWNNAPRIDDLEEVSMQGVGMEDGKFDQGDYFLWYAEGPDQWTYDPASRSYHMDKNIYDELNHYYIIINVTSRTPVSFRDNGPSGQYESNTSLIFQRLEEEKVNLLGRYRPPGSGQEWYGDELAVIDALDYTTDFDLTNIVPSDTFYFKVRFAARAQDASRFYVYFNQYEFSKSVGSVDLDNFEASFANDAIIQNAFKPQDAINKIQIKYPGANGINARAWIDYIEINSWKQNNYTPGHALYLQDPRSKYLGTPKFEISGIPSTGMVWDISNPLKPVVQQYDAAGGQISFSVPQVVATPNRFVAFVPGQDALNPEYENIVKNQNLHNLQSADLIIVYYDGFEKAALKLAEHRRMYDQLLVAAIPVSQVMEEFGGGSYDPSAI